MHLLSLQSVLEVEVASERSDCEVVDSLDCIDEREIRSLADTKNHTPQEKNKDLVTKRDVEAVHSYDTILKHIPPNARNRSVRRAGTVSKVHIQCFTCPTATRPFCNTVIVHVYYW